uniref:Ceramide synthase 2-like n=1 Tax=Mastacembelus armatus TaxID=205130 RepID=A0A7N8WSI1_9TELE
LLSTFDTWDYWLPPGVTWRDMEQLEGSDRPQPLDLLVALPLALGFVTLRYVFERFLVPPMGRCLGVKNRLQMSASPSPKLESFYRHEIVALMSLCGKTQRQIETWFRLRRNQDRPCQTKKFGEAAWRFFFYLTAFTAGLACLIDVSVNLIMQKQNTTIAAHYWYYMLELGFYGSLLLRISVDVKRKDFKEQVIHHLATIFLLSFSYCANYIRVGTLVMLLHDSSDILLELEKDERSEESEIEEEEVDKGEENANQEGDNCWGRSKDTLNSKLSMLATTCVLNNLTNHMASAADRIRKAQ